jgi:ribosomal protein L32
MITNKMIRRSTNVTKRTFSIFSNNNNVASTVYSYLSNFFQTSLSPPPPPPLFAYNVATEQQQQQPFSISNTSDAKRAGLIQDILGGFMLMAVPKHRVTRSKKRIKNYRKRIVADVKHIQICERCGETKLRHILCECVVKDDSWKQHRDDNSWLNAGNMKKKEEDPVKLKPNEDEQVKQ